MPREPKFEDYSYKPYVPPVMTPQRRTDIRKAAIAHADADHSDPFAYGRITLHMKRGLVLPSDVLADARAKLAARAGAKAVASDD